MRDDQARLEDILRAIASIARYAERGRPAFDRDELIQSWMIYHLTLIGEARRPALIGGTGPASGGALAAGHRHAQRPRPRVLRDRS